MSEAPQTEKKPKKVSKEIPGSVPTIGRISALLAPALSQPTKEQLKKHFSDIVSAVIKTLPSQSRTETATPRRDASAATVEQPAETEQESKREETPQEPGAATPGSTDSTNYNYLRNILEGPLPKSARPIDFTRTKPSERIDGPVDLKTAAEDVLRKLLKIEPNESIEEALKRHEVQDKAAAKKWLEYIQMRLALEMNEQQDLEALANEEATSNILNEIEEKEDIAKQAAEKGVGAQQEAIDLIRHNQKLTKGQYNTLLANAVGLASKRRGLSIKAGFGAYLTYDENGHPFVVITSFDAASFEAAARQFKNKVEWSGIPKSKQHLAEMACLRQGKKCYFDGRETILSSTMPPKGPQFWSIWITNINQISVSKRKWLGKTKGPEQQLQTLISEVVGDDPKKLQEFLDDIATEPTQQVGESEEDFKKRQDATPKRREQVAKLLTAKQMETLINKVVGNDPRRLREFWDVIATEPTQNAGESDRDFKKRRDAAKKRREQIAEHLTSEQMKILEDAYADNIKRYKEQITGLKKELAELQEQPRPFDEQTTKKIAAKEQQLTFAEKQLQSAQAAQRNLYAARINALQAVASTPKSINPATNDLQIARQSCARQLLQDAKEECEKKAGDPVTNDNIVNQAIDNLKKLGLKDAEVTAVTTEILAENVRNIAKKPQTDAAREQELEKSVNKLVEHLLSAEPGITVQKVIAKLRELGLPEDALIAATNAIYVSKINSLDPAHNQSELSNIAEEYNSFLEKHKELRKKVEAATAGPFYEAREKIQQTLSPSSPSAAPH